MLLRTIILFTFFSAFASSKVIDHEVLQCATKAFTDAWWGTFNKFVGLTPNYPEGTFVAVECTQIPNMRCNAIPENAKCKRKYCGIRRGPNHFALSIARTTSTLAWHGYKTGGGPITREGLGDPLITPRACTRAQRYPHAVGGVGEEGVGRVTSIERRKRKRIAAPVFQPIW
ncbi:hypothetical protein B0F90DRAFT_1668617 [Multifurca ochricompacta]|uniref:Secreted protein n=1 Tax=Multifurca ochricompacta TaxID=376703 RepID=A0AAD4QMZ6_9AGAM|nr:hypothetical protein B0F90DRAFT_1668617 [Multifurca ochricompacta]